MTAQVARRASSEALTSPQPARTDSSAVAPEGAFSIDIPVRVDDLSPSMHISNVAFLRYADEGRMAWFGLSHPRAPQGAGGPREAFGDVASTVVARNEIEYRREVFPDEGAVTLRLWIPHVGNSSFVVAGEITTAAHGAPAMVVESTVVLVERSTGRPWTIDARTREALATWGGPRPVLRGRPGI